MSKINKIGFISHVSEITFVGPAKTTAKQTIVLHIPGYEYQDKVVEDEDYELDIIGSKVDQLNIHTRDIAEKVDCTFFIKSRKWEKDGKTSYFMKANLTEVKRLGSTLAKLIPADRVDDQPF